MIKWNEKEQTDMDKFHAAFMQLLLSTSYLCIEKKNKINSTHSPFFFNFYIYYQATES